MKKQTPYSYNLPRASEMQYHREQSPSALKEIAGHITGDDIILIFSTPDHHHLSINHIPADIEEVSLMKCMARAIFFALTKEQARTVGPAYDQFRNSFFLNRTRNGEREQVFTEQFEAMMMQVSLKLKELKGMPRVYLFYRNKSTLYLRIMEHLLGGFCYDTKQIKPHKTESGDVLMRDGSRVGFGYQKPKYPSREVPFCPELIKLCYLTSGRPVDVLRVLDVRRGLIDLGNLRTELHKYYRELRDSFDRDYLNYFLDSALIADKKFVVDDVLARNLLVSLNEERLLALKADVLKLLLQLIPEKNMANLLAAYQHKQPEATHDDMLRVFMEHILATYQTEKSCEGDVDESVKVLREVMPEAIPEKSHKIMMIEMYNFFTHTCNNFADQLNICATTMAVGKVLAMMRVLLPENPEDQELALMTFLISRAYHDTELFPLLDRCKVYSDPKALNKIDPVYDWMQNVIGWAGRGRVLQDQRFFELLTPCYKFLQTNPDLISTNVDEALKRRFDHPLDLDEFKRDWVSMRIKFQLGITNVDRLFFTSPQALIRPQHDRLLGEKGLFNNWVALKVLKRPQNLRQKIISTCYPMSRDKGLKIFFAIFALLNFMLFAYPMLRGGLGVAKNIWDNWPDTPDCDGSGHIRHCEL